MAFTEEYKIFINNLFDLKGYNGKHLVRVVYQLLRSYGLLGGSTVVPSAADDAVPAHSC